MTMKTDNAALETPDAIAADSVDARLRALGRLVELPVARDRRRRYWMVWLLWGMLGTALTFEGVEDGTWLAEAGF